MGENICKWWDQKVINFQNVVDIWIYNSCSNIFLESLWVISNKEVILDVTLQSERR